MPPVRQVVDEGGESVADMREVAPDLRTVIHENRDLRRHIRQLRAEHVAALSILLDDELVGRQVEHRLAAADHAHERRLLQVLRLQSRTRTRSRGDDQQRDDAGRRSTSGQRSSFHHSHLSDANRRRRTSETRGTHSHLVTQDRPGRTNGRTRATSPNLAWKLSASEGGWRSHPPKLTWTYTRAKEDGAPCPLSLLRSFSETRALKHHPPKLAREYMRAKEDGAPCRIRTCDLLVRSQTLYPAELRARVWNQRLTEVLSTLPAISARRIGGGTGAGVRSARCQRSVAAEFRRPRASDLRRPQAGPMQQP